MSFAPITEEFDELFARTLPPAARTLWSWLRRQAPSGREMEFNLEDFVQKFDYSLKWGRKALTALIDNGLVNVVKKFYGYGFRVVVHQIGELKNGKKTSTNGDESSSDWNKTSPKQPSIPHSLVNNNKEESIEDKNLTQELPSLHPVLIDSKVDETASQPAQLIQNPEHLELLRQAENLGIHLNNNLVSLALKHSVEVLKNAIAALKEQLSAGKAIKSPAGFLTNAIRRGWKPNAHRHSRRSPESSLIELELSPERAIAESQPTSLLPQPLAQILPSITYDFSDTLTTIQLNIRRLGWTLEIVGRSLSERYQVPKQRLLSDEQLLDWADFLASCGNSGTDGS